MNGCQNCRDGMCAGCEKQQDMTEAEIAEAVEAKAVEDNREEGDSGELV